MIINPLMLPNVRMEKNESKDNKEFPTLLKEVVYSLATSNPMWTFECFMGFSHIDSIHVWCDGQRIGVMGSKYSSRAGTRAVSLTCDNITARNNTITSSDVKKAIREAKRNFAPKPIGKLMQDKIKIAKNVLSNQIYKKHSRMEDNIRASRPYMTDFAMVEKRAEFESFLSVTHNGRQMIESLRQADELKEELLSLENISMSKELVLIWRDKGKYIVHTLDNVQTYDDNSIPEQYRSKLGMLKLVEEKQCISDVGCRAEEDLFLLVGN